MVSEELINKYIIDCGVICGFLGLFALLFGLCFLFYNGEDFERKLGIALLGIASISLLIAMIVGDFIDKRRLFFMLKETQREARDVVV
jgi:hypothetical protein